MNIELPEMFRRPDMLVLPELVSLGRYATSQARLGGARPDSHDGFEIGYLESGMVEWWNGETVEEAKAGSILIDRPGDWQGGATAIVHPCVRYWVRFEFPFDGGLYPLARTTLNEGFDQVRQKHFPATNVVAAIFREMLEQQRQPDQLSEFHSRALFHQLLALTLRFHSQANSVRISGVVESAIQFINAEIERQITVPELAERFGLSVGHWSAPHFDRTAGIADKA